MAMAAGLAGMLYALSPSGGRPEDVRWYAWATGIAVNLALVAALVAWGRRQAGGGPRQRPRAARCRRPCSRSRRAPPVGLDRGPDEEHDQHVLRGDHGGSPPGLTSWQLYAMIASGVVGMFLVQSALNAGRP